MHFLFCLISNKRQGEHRFYHLPPRKASPSPPIHTALVPTITSARRYPGYWQPLESLERITVTVCCLPKGDFGLLVSDVKANKKASNDDRYFLKVISQVLVRSGKVWMWVVDFCDWFWTQVIRIEAAHLKFEICYTKKTLNTMKNFDHVHYISLKYNQREIVGRHKRESESTATQV